MTSDPKKRLRWRLRIVMAERNVTSATQLQRMLNHSGYEITSSQLTRIIKDRPDRISTDLLDHLLTILDCNLNDLLRMDDESQPEEIRPMEYKDIKTNSGTKKKVRRPANTVYVNEEILGPKVTQMSIPASRK